jgi:hypothetical protein
LTLKKHALKENADVARVLKQQRQRAKPTERVAENRWRKARGSQTRRPAGLAALASWTRVRREGGVEDDPKLLECAQHQPHLGGRFSLLQLDDPEAADAHAIGQFDLAPSELRAAFAKKHSNLAGGFKLHLFHDYM